MPMRNFIFTLFVLLPLAMRAQETGYRDFGGRIDSTPIPAELPWSENEIGTWEPAGEFAEQMRPRPVVSMSSMMKRRDNDGRKVIVMPDNTLRLWWRIEISNGSAGNWGTAPASFLDARTLSFPTP